ncbi:hypothetical protein JHK85_023104 [Glycine max]|nr:hypothetical protein JHK85_023104 [Glycine max]
MSGVVVVEDEGEMVENSEEERKRSRIGSLKKMAIRVSSIFTHSLKKRGKRKIDFRIPIEDVRDAQEEFAVQELHQRLLQRGLRGTDIEKTIQMWEEMLIWRKGYETDAILQQRHKLPLPLRGFSSSRWLSMSCLQFIRSCPLGKTWSLIKVVAGWVVNNTSLKSKETISRQFNDVLRAVMKVSKDYLNFQPCTLEGAEANKWRWFERCIGALDETHIPVTVSPDERPRYRNRISTNVLVACGPDLRFIYVLPGWEGSAGDSRVLRDALRRQNKLEIPTGKYFLVDAGYTNGPGFLAPYRGTRYHLNEWIGNTPQSYKELFNLRHASARNAIERSFGILKKRWSILRTPSFFDIKTQIRIINACFVLHNFIRDEQQTDQLLEVQDLEFLSVVDEELVHQSREEVQNNVIDDITTIQATEEWIRFRDTLAMNMFANYQVRRNFT